MGIVGPSGITERNLVVVNKRGEISTAPLPQADVLTWRSLSLCARALTPVTSRPSRDWAPTPTTPTY